MSESSTRPWTLQTRSFSVKTIKPRLRMLLPPWRTRQNHPKRSAAYLRIAALLTSPCVC